jgi:hypothetical protein
MAPDAPASSTPVTLQLHAELYPLAAIEAGVQAFAALADFTVERDGDHHRVTLRPRGAGPAEELGRKFANYVLGVIGVTVPSG